MTICSLRSGLEVLDSVVFMLRATETCRIIGRFWHGLQNEAAKPCPQSKDMLADTHGLHQAATYCAQMSKLQS